jgi:oligopeptide/dipeptide ABC transporter ATP-binding protein
MIALALAGEPQLLLADEVTTALDVTIQDQILGLLLDIRRETGMAIILVSHDMGVVAETCDHVAVMYAGSILEIGAVADIFLRPRHPYTRALLDAIPRLDGDLERGRLQPVAGQPPDIRSLPRGCPFAARCQFVRSDCENVDMSMIEVEPGHVTACPFSPDAWVAFDGLAEERTARV